MTWTRLNRWYAFTQRRVLGEGVEWHACGSWQSADGRCAVTPDDAHEPPRALPDIAGSDLLDYGQLIIADMRTTTGEGEPDDGAQFDEGHREFSMVCQALRSAAADERWDGAGARAYADQNTRQ